MCKIVHEIGINVTPKTFESLSHQGMTCAQSICELVDNALASYLSATTARVCIALAMDPSRDFLQLAIADWGCGMDLDALTNALQLGSQPLTDNRLHEHGHGLNNALASLTGAVGDWCLYTRSGFAPYLKVQSPFDLKMMVEEVPFVDLPLVLNFVWPDPSTVIVMRVPMTIARTLQRQGTRKLSDLATLRTWLIEHLGVTYRGYLEQNSSTMEPAAKMVVTIGADKKLVPPIHVPMMMTHTERFSVELNGKVIPLVYHHGLLDKPKCEHLVCGEKAKYYYRCSQPTQGIDIRLGKRVIATAQLDEIWQSKDGSPLNRHNSYNDFVGELLIPELPRGVLPTLNNKTGIDRNSLDWEILTSAMQQFPPQKGSALLSEKELQQNWMLLLKAVNPQDEVTSEISVWPTGTRIDVVDKDDSGKFDIYELKAKKAEPQHLYQLKMYWDGLVLEGIQPTKGTLLVPSYPDSLETMVKLMNDMPTPLFPDGTPSAPYNFSLATLKGKNLIDR